MTNTFKLIGAALILAIGLVEPADFLVLFFMALWSPLFFFLDLVEPAVFVFCFLFFMALWSPLFDFCDAMVTSTTTVSIQKNQKKGFSRRSSTITHHLACSMHLAMSLVPTAPRIVT